MSAKPSVLDASHCYQYQSRLRADLSGGTLDIWPIYLAIENSITIQLSLNLYTDVQLIENKNSKEITIHTSRQTDSYPNLKTFLNTAQPELRLAQVVAHYMKPPSGFTLQFHSDSPLGGGLGSSSGLLVGMVQCFSKWLKQNRSLMQTVYLCRDLEAQLLNAPTGIQDYIIPLQTPSIQYPWVNQIQLLPIEPKITPIAVPETLLDQLVLIDTRVTHHSGQNNWQTLHSAFQDKKSFSLLKELSMISLEMAEIFKNKNFEKIPDVFQKEYEIRKQIKGYTNRQIESIRQFVLSNGGKAIKVMGAGGGGCLLAWTSNKKKLIESCLDHNIKILKGFE